MLRFTKAVAFPRITHEHAGDAAPPQGHVHLFGLSDVHIVILLAVNEHRGRLRLPHVTKRRPLPKQIVIVPRKAAKLGVDQILIQRGRIKTDQVAHARDGNSSLKARRLRNDPIRHEPAVAATCDAETILIDP